jgi:hypothetical protein
MGDRQFSGSFGLGALLVAVLYGFMPQAVSPPSAPPSTGNRTLDEPTSSVSLLDDFLSTGGPETVALGKYHVCFMIATLPDPIDSHFASNFDRGLNAIVSAMSDAGYDIDRWSLPWRTPGPEEFQASWSATPGGLPRIDSRPAAPTQHHDEPGSVLFRRGDDLVLVYLVGETPTHGLQKAAFQAAVKSLRGFEQSHSPEHAPQTLLVLGPYFSGTAESLHLALKSVHSDRSVRVLSGSATSTKNRDLIQGEGISYGSTSLPDREMLAALDEYFRRIHVTPCDVALLVEDGTAYAQDFTTDTLECAGQKDESGTHQKDKPATHQREAPATHPRLVLRFPLQISQIRTAYEKRDAARRGTPSQPQPHRALEMSLEGPEKPRDALSPYEPRMTANAAELVLASAFDTVRRQRIRYLGIVASDTRDVLFLARKAREFSADAHLFTFGADILFQHPDALPYLDGLVVVTTYPLLGPYQAWHGVASHHRSFPGSSEEGIYNAMLFLLGHGEKALDYSPPGPGTTSHQPPVWIVANGRHGFWPLDVFPSRISPDSVPEAPVRLEGDTPHGWPAIAIPNGAFVLFLLWSAGGSLFVYGHRRYRAVGLAGVQEGAKADSAALAESPGAGTVRDRLRAFFAGCAGQTHIFMNFSAMAGLAMILAVFEASLTVQFARWITIGDPGVVYTLRCAVAAAIGVAVTYFTSQIAYQESSRFVHVGRTLEVEEGARVDARSTAEVRRAFFFNAVILTVVAVYAVLVVGFTVSVVTSANVFLLLCRSFDLGSRVGFLLPLFLGSLTLVLFTISEVRRSILYEEQRFRIPTGEPPQSLLALLEPYGAFTHLIRNPAASLFAALAPLVGLAVFHALFVGFGLYRSLDGWAWGALATMLLSFSGWSVAWSVLEFREIWRRLSALLRILSWSPLADAFNRMPDGLAKSQWKMWRTPPTLTSLHVSVSHLQTLVSLGRTGGLSDNLQLDQEVVNAQKSASQEFTGVLARANEGHASTQAQRKELRTHLAQATMGVCRLLEGAWTSWPSKADIADKSEKEQEALNTVVWLRRQVPKPPDVFIRIAEEYVAVRFVSFIHYAFSHLRNVLTFTLAGFVLLVALMASYPFQPMHPIIGIVWVVGLLGIAAVVWAFVDMDRNLILSYIAKTKPGQVDLNLDFATKLVVYGLVPLITLLATQFPEIGEWVLTVLNPAVKGR